MVLGLDDIILQLCLISFTAHLVILVSRSKRKELEIRQLLGVISIT